MTDTYGCDDCNKSSLSLLLLRPSPVGKLPELAAAGAHVVVSDPALTAGLLPARLPTESRFALRLLRAGYVHVYIAAPPAGLKNWLSYRVTDQADIVPDSSSWFAQPKANVTCKRGNMHNAMGIKLLNIPEAHKITELWIAFSANLWNETLRAKNAANPSVMQKVLLSGGSPNTFKPTADALKTKVLECALDKLRIDKASEHDFAFNSVKNLVDDLAKNLRTAAAGHKKTANHEMAIVLRDPVGIATELNELRLRKYNLAQKEMEKPENAHPLNSSNALMGLKKATVDDGYRKAQDNVAPIITERFFKERYANSKNPANAGAVWEPLDEDEQKALNSAVPMGRLWTNQARELWDVQSPIFRDVAWKKISSEYSERARAEWLKEFDIKMKKLHFNALAKYEADWWEACQDAQFKNYFALHFDEKDPNDPKKKFSCGLTYASEVKNALTPHPNTAGDICTRYVKQLREDISNPGSVMLRAMGGNQADVLAKIKEVLSIPQHLHDNRNDKLYNLAAGMVTMGVGSATPGAIQKVMVRYSWLAPMLGDLFGGYTLIITKSFSAAVTSTIVRSGFAAFNSDLGRYALNLMGGLHLVQRTSDLALSSIVSRSQLKFPMQVSKRYPLREAIRLLGVRGSHSRGQLARAAEQGFLDLVLLTDNIEMRSFGGNIDSAVAKGGGKVQLAREVVPAVLHTAATPRTILLSSSQFETAFQDRVKIRNTMGAWVQEGFKDANSVVSSLEGRLAIGVIIINIAGLLISLKTRNDEDPRVSFNSWVGVLDTGSSILGGSVQLIEYGVKASFVARLGADAVNRSVAIHTLRASSQLLGAFSGLVCAIGQFAKAKDAVSDGYVDLMVLYTISGVAFGGTAVTGGAAATLAYAERQVTKRVASVLMQRLVMRYSAAGVASMTSASLTGWGLVFLGAAVLFEVLAIVRTPSKTQEFVQRTYFGRGKGRYAKFGDWNAENVALEKLFAPEPVIAEKVLTEEETTRRKEMEPTIWAAM